MMRSGEQLSEIVGPAYHKEGTYPEAYSGQNYWGGGGIKKAVPGGNGGLAREGRQLVRW